MDFFADKEIERIAKNMGFMGNVHDEMRANQEFRQKIGEKLVEDSRDPEEVMRECYYKMIDIYKYYMDMPDSSIILHVLYDIGTWLHHRFTTFPYLYINAMKGSGKTRLIKLHSHFAKGGNGQYEVGITDAVLYRTPKHHTLIYDECESISQKEMGKFREYLNVCYKQGAVVKRNKKVKDSTGEDYKIELFEPFKPVIMANINGMDEVVNDRSIVTILEKSSKQNVVMKLEDFDTNQDIKVLNELLRRFSVVVSCRYVSGGLNKVWNTYIDSIYNDTIYNDTKQHIDTEELDADMLSFFNKIRELGVNGRNLELFFPLFGIARMIGDDVLDDFLEVVKDIVSIKKEDALSESNDIMFFDFVASQPQEITYVPIKEVSRKFREWTGGEDFANEKWIGRALKRLGLSLSMKRMAAGRQVILNVAKAKEKLKIFKTEEVDK